MNSSLPKLNLVVAVCNNGGIGCEGRIPWRIKHDLAFFKKLTSNTESPNKQYLQQVLGEMEPVPSDSTTEVIEAADEYKENCPSYVSPATIAAQLSPFPLISVTAKDAAVQMRPNAVIMGRKTWFSIPEKMRPLPGRINIVLSQTLTKAPAGAHLASSLNEAVKIVTSGPLAAHIESIFIIGGSTVYSEAISSIYPCRLYLTRVLRDYECDTFFPKIDWSGFKQIFVSDIPSEILTENGVDFKFEVFEKV